MPLSSLVLELQKSNLTEQLIERASRSSRLLLKGTGRAAKALITTSMCQRAKRPLLLILPTLEEATRYYSLLCLMGWNRVYLYPTTEASPYESINSDTEIIWGQLQVLSDLISNKSNAAFE